MYSRLSKSHSHPLNKTPSKSSSGPYTSGFICDSCRRRTPSHHRWHCHSCQYDLCEGCMEREQDARLSRMHSHLLIKCPRSDPTGAYRNGFICNGCRGRSNTAYRWHCTACSYDLCEDCMRDESSSVLDLPGHHVHPLTKCRARGTGAYSSGFVCDSCRKHTPTQYRWNCSRCNFDLCEDCTRLTPIIQSCNTHSHPLKKTAKYDHSGPYRNGYKCDICRLSSPTQYRWNCFDCRYDLCEDCMNYETGPKVDVRNHSHPLSQVPARSIGSRSYRTGYICNVCRKSSPSQTRWNCRECEYDLCESCFGAERYGSSNQINPTFPGMSFNINTGNRPTGMNNSTSNRDPIENLSSMLNSFSLQVSSALNGMMNGMHGSSTTGKNNSYPPSTRPPSQSQSPSTPSGMNSNPPTGMPSNPPTSQSYPTSGMNSTPPSIPDTNKSTPQDTPTDNLENTCKVCFDSQIDSILIPCFHLCLCSTCANKIMDINAICPMCNGQISQVQKVYKS
eukprot:TRINITY_DN179_c0_g1_i2.p1 TRINITY_DN179_c0_g1~~TRINITY_DN179_c0_g1_i2.p1  ORF type:complete len:504 (+),score=18.71 TRINITY_DN179_c0_g1_i2:1-1512(+)